MKGKKEVLIVKIKKVPESCESVYRKLNNLDKLYDLIINFYEREWTWKKK